MSGLYTDLNEAQWAILAPLLPPAKPGGRPRTTNLRGVLDAVFYPLRTVDGQSVEFVVLAEAAIASEQARLRSTIQVRPLILNARWPRRVMISFQPSCYQSADVRNHDF